MRLARLSLDLQLVLIYLNFTVSQWQYNGCIPTIIFKVDINYSTLSKTVFIKQCYYTYALKKWVYITVKMKLLFLQIITCGYLFYANLTRLKKH